jgi:hypothetical protein
MAQLEPSKPGPQSALWARRSRRRTLRTVDLELGAVHGAARAFGVSLNDLFVAAVAAAAGRYHRHAGLELERLTVSFIVSTREGAEVAGNAFSPIKACVPAGMQADAVAPFVAAVGQELAARRAEAGGGAGLLASLAGAVNLLPTSVVTRLARTQAASVDLATSNVRAAPFPVHIAGARVLASYPIGPVAATAGNVTMMSYDGQIHLGLHLDPRAIEDPDRFRAEVEAAFAGFVAAAGPAPVTPGGSNRRRRSSTAPSSARRRRAPT